MGTIIGRIRKDGSKAFTAQILIKKGGAIVHRESQSFDCRQAANAWIVKRKEGLKRPGGLERKEDPAYLRRPQFEEHARTVNARPRAFKVSLENELIADSAAEVSDELQIVIPAAAAA